METLGLRILSISNLFLWRMLRPDGKFVCGEEKGYAVDSEPPLLTHAEAAARWQSWQSWVSAVTRISQSCERTARWNHWQWCMYQRALIIWTFEPTWYFIIEKQGKRLKWSSLYSQICRQIWVRVTTNKDPWKSSKKNSVISFRIKFEKFWQNALGLRIKKMQNLGF